MATVVQSQNAPKCNVLTQARVKELLHYDPETGIFRWREGVYKKSNAGKVAGCVGRKGYLKITVDRHCCRAHRLAWLYVTGAWPENEIDHRNGNTSDNRLENLREATRAENSRNTKMRVSSSGLKGAYRHVTGRWYASISKEGRRYFLGLFNTAEDAHQAYKAKAQELFGDFARQK